jgi:hypothetical protein
LADTISQRPLIAHGGAPIRTSDGAEKPGKLSGLERFRWIPAAALPKLFL